MTTRNICRTCLRTTRENSSIHDSIRSASDQATIVIADLLKQMPIVNFTDSNELPTDICNSCLNEIERIFTFLLQCEQTEMLLQKANIIEEKCSNSAENIKTESKSKPSRRRKNISLLDNDFSTFSKYKSAAPDDSLLDNKCGITIKTEVEDDEEETSRETIMCQSSHAMGASTVLIKEEPELDLYADVNTALSDDQSDLEIKLEPETINLDEEFSSLRTYLQNPECFFDCSNCSVKFKSKWEYETHLDSCSILHECDVCLMAFQDKDNLLEHMKNAHGEEDVTIANTSNHPTVESDTALSDGEIYTHKRSFSKKNSTSPESGTLDKLYFCFYCPKQFATERRLEGHMAVHTKSHTCKQCIKSFRSNHHLKAHNMRVHGITWKKIECGVCHKYFACKADLVRHQLTHTKEKPYKCKWCTLRYRYKKFLENHIKQTHAISEETMQAYLKEEYGTVKFEYQLTSTFTCNVCGLEVDRSLLAAHVNGHKNTT